MKVHDQTRRLEDRLRKINSLFGFPRLYEDFQGTFAEFVIKTIDMIPDAFHVRDQFAARIIWKGTSCEFSPFFEITEVLSCEIRVKKEVKGVLTSSNMPWPMVRPATGSTQMTNDF